MCATTSDKQAFAGGEAPSGDPAALRPGSGNWGTGGCDLFLKVFLNFSLAAVSRFQALLAVVQRGLPPPPPRGETPQRAGGEGDVAGGGAQHGCGGSRAVRLTGKPLVFFLTGNVTNGPYCLFLFWCKFLQVLRLELLHRSRIAAIPSTSLR